MKTTTGILFTILATSLVAQPVLAGNKGRHDRGHYSDYARVEHVEPVYRVVNVPVSHEECGYEEVTRYSEHNSRRSESYTPMILGGILGGVVGNRFGKGGGNKALTIAGTVLGASVGNDVSANNHSQAQPYRTTERRCHTVTDYREQQELEGYRVTYRYNGRSYTTTMPRDPGDRIRVNVDVRPAY